MILLFAPEKGFDKGKMKTNLLLNDLQSKVRRMTFPLIFHSKQHLKLVLFVIKNIHDKFLSI